MGAICIAETDVLDQMPPPQDQVHTSARGAALRRLSQGRPRQARVVSGHPRSRSLNPPK